MKQSACLYLVATPIGHLDDMTYRAVMVLQKVDLIAAEDTRHSQRLLQHYRVETPCISLHEHNESSRVARLLSYLDGGKSIALISDAGTPLISDPGFVLVRAVREAGYDVVPVPGPCALIAALTISGLPTDRFCFEGFLPAKKGTMTNKLLALQAETRTMIFYESVHRVMTTLIIMRDVFGGDREAVVARELTKTYETVCSGTLAFLCDWMTNDANQRRGEFVVVVKGVLEEGEADEKQAKLHKLLPIVLAELSVKQSVALLVELLDLPKKQVYATALQFKNK